jgi:DNA-binding transcriptional LysR family regulator
LEFTSLRYFFEAARAGSIRQAAEHIHVVPSAISRQIAKLEHELGAPLLERHYNGVRLTPAGRLLADQLEVTVRDLARIRSQIDELKGLRRGEVTIYCIEGLVDTYLPSAITKFRESYHEITFRIVVASTDRIIEALVADESDIGITLNAPKRPDLTCCAWWEEPLEVVVAPFHALSRRRSIGLAELAKFSVALPETSFGVRRLVDRNARKNGVELKLVTTTNSILAANAMARHGGVYTLMPRFAVARDCEAGTLVTVPIKNRNLELSRVEICVHRGRTLPVAPREFLSSLIAAPPGPPSERGVRTGGARLREASSGVSADRTTIA